MIPVELAPKLPSAKFEEYADGMFRELCEASQDTPTENVFDAFTVQNIVGSELLTLDVSAATLGQLRQIVGTLIRYVQKRGPKRA